MSDDAASRWKDMILDHYKHPRFYGAPEDLRWSAEEHNRTCGDRIEVYASGGEGEHLNFSFTGAGCSLCIASSSLMCTLLQNADRETCLAALSDFQKIWEQGSGDASSETWVLLANLRQYPVRARCVRLPWQALQSILEQWYPISSEAPRES